MIVASRPPTLRGDAGQGFGVGPALCRGSAADVDRVQVVAVEHRVVELDGVGRGRGEDLSQPLAELVVGWLGRPEREDAARC